MWAALGYLGEEVHSETVKALSALSQARADGVAAPTARNCGLVLPLVLADRWLHDFTMGLRLTDSDAVLPASLHSTEQRVRLCATVEAVLVTHLEWSVMATCRLNESVTVPLHLWIVEEELTVMDALRTFLPVDWRIQTTGIESSLQLACASKPLDAAHHPVRFLESTFAPHFAAQADLNRSSWYQDSAAVIEAARLAARGELVESPLSRQLREAHVRPMRFWGVSDSIDRPLHRACAFSGGFYVLPYIFSREHAFVSFELTDAMDRVFQMLLVGERDGSPLAMCFVSLPESSYVLCLAAFLCDVGDQPARWSAATGPRGDDTPMALDEFRAHADYAQHNATETAASERAEVRVASINAINTETSSAVASSSYSAPVSASAPASSVVEDPSDFLPASTRAEVECACRAATPLLQFSLFGPSIFADNHPPAMRRLFTAHLVDECMLRAGLTPLPLVLSELIADYHSFDLPFREDKAAEQMRQAGLQLREQNPDKATYEGQLDSRVERVCDAETKLDQRFPVADLEEDEADAEAPADEGDVAAGAEEED